jgi:hypothetical protein
MSGELRATQDWVHVEPSDAAPTPPKKKRKRKPAPRTTVGMLVYGLRRFVVAAGALCGTVALIAFLIARLGSGHFVHVLTIAFYFAGAVVGAFAFLSGTGSTRMSYWEPADTKLAFSDSLVLICFAALMVGIAVALEVFA